MPPRSSSQLFKGGIPLTRRIEEYVETIYELSKGGGLARVKDVAEKLGVSLPTVTEMFQKLSTQGYVNYEPYSGATLTEEGLSLARGLERRHGALKEFFILLGLPEERADEEACRIEHVVEGETVERLLLFLRFLKEEDRMRLMEEFLLYRMSEEKGEG
ncbi:MAG: metal-dependent transcriptional regulator [Thermoplasmata archaeon]|nr:MAG: metal-dependent transcriptional regulator [Thermoplasmata archaeon]RLF74664.1 MAG: metal-dependent transcriptional regulator [Thermoplasmata archaeon]